MLIFSKLETYTIIRVLDVGISKRQKRLKRHKRRKGWFGHPVDSDFPYVPLAPLVIARRALLDVAISKRRKRHKRFKRRKG